MRRWLHFTVLGTMLAALVPPPAHARSTSVRATAPVAPAPRLGFHPDAGIEAINSPMPEPPARPQPAAKLPLCHEVTSVGVVVERATACSRPRQ
jgi:hypothetical protein